MERLIQNDLPSAELHAQGRMLSEISRLLKPIYAHLSDIVAETGKLSPPRCVASAVFFWHCPHPEQNQEACPYTAKQKSQRGYVNVAEQLG